MPALPRHFRYPLRAILLLSTALGAVGAAPPLAAQTTDILLITTTSVRDAGLLDTLIPPFERETGFRVRVVAVGSGQAMALGRRGEADILILHDPPGEERFVADGFGVERRALMRNEFVIVGPPDDPAAIRGMSAPNAFRAIARAGAKFLSRGDRSGTHAREMRVWEGAGIAPSDEWYLESGQGMGATLVVADQLGAYTLTDIGTWLAHRAPIHLTVLVDGDTLLANPYHVVLASPERFRRVNAAGARRLAEYLLSPTTQRLIGEFRRAEFGRPLFVPAAADPD